MERNIRQRGRPFCVAEAHSLVANIACDRRTSVARPQSRLFRFIENLENAFARCASRLHKLIELMQTRNWLVKKSSQRDEGDQRTDLHLSMQNGVAAEADRQRQPERIQKIHRGTVNGPRPHDAQRRQAKRVAGARTFISTGKR